MMNSRERVIASIEHREPDRVPVDFGGHRSSGISAIAYAKLKKALGIEGGDIYVYDVVQQLAIVEVPVLDALGADVVQMGMGFSRGVGDWKPWVLPDGTPCKIPSYVDVQKRGEDWYLRSSDGVDLGIQKKGCYYFEQIHYPWIGSSFEDDPFEGFDEAFARSMWTATAVPGSHVPLTDEGLKQLRAGAKALRESTDRAIIGLFGGNLFEIPQFLFRMDNYLTYMGMYPDACVRLSEKLSSYHLARLERWLGAVGPYIDIVLFSDDMGGQNGPLLSPAMYRSYYKPYHKKMWGRAKELAKVKVQLHTCGGIEPLLEDLVEAGMDMFNPVQISCAGMDPKRLKKKYGGRITFWGGGCDTRHVLPRGTPEEVKRHVRDQMRTLSPGGGFVFQQVHNIQADVPVENILAMFEAAHGG
jgi:uroporphyrinogen decarboxylase